MEEMYKVEDVRERCNMHTDEILEKLEQAKESGNFEETILSFFAACEMDMRTIWTCRDYLITDSESFFKKYPALISLRCVIEAMAGRLDSAEAFLDLLGKPIDDLKKSKPGPLDIIRIMTEIVMPQVDNVRALSHAYYLADSLNSPLLGLALTACRPSVINGFRDMTEFCPSMEANEAIVCKAIEKIYGRSGKGVYEVALAEWKYETGNAFEALLIIASVIPTLEGVKDVRCLFTAYMLQMRILVFGGQTKTTSEIFEKIRKKVEDNYYDELKDSLDAAICLYHCYEADYDYIENWLENKAPNENKDVFLMDMYCYLVKMRVYLQTGKYMLTILLSKQMISYLEQGHRPHDMCECLLLTAMACLKAGDEPRALENFIKALEIGNKYGYVRVFSDEGQIVVELIKLYKDACKRKDIEYIESFDEEWLKKIRGYALEVASRYPDYLKTRQEEYATLTKTERQIVLLMSMGLPNEDIANQMDKKVKTIKFHITNIFRKLNVSNRQQAINRAKEVGYL